MGMSSSCMKQLGVFVGLFFKIYFYKYEKDQINNWNLQKNLQQQQQQKRVLIGAKFLKKFFE